VVKSKAPSLDVALQYAVAGQSAVQRLCRVLRLADAFELEIVTCPVPVLATVLIDWLTDQLESDGRPVLHLLALPAQAGRGFGIEDIARGILDPLANATGHLVFLDASAALADDYAAWRWMFHRLNERRNGLAAVLASPIVLLLPRWLEAVLPAEAPDLWSVRSLTIELLATEPPRREAGRTGARPDSSDGDLEALEQQAVARSLNATPGSVAGRRAYAAALRRFADAAVDRVDPAQLRRYVDDELVPLTATIGDPIEQARAFRSQAALRLREGDSLAALEILENLALPLVEHIDAERAAALIQLAEVLEARGDSDEAMRLLQDHVLPIQDRLGDEAAKVTTLAAIANTRLARGELDEARGLLHDEILPFYVRTGNDLARAHTMARIAAIAHARGDLDEALRIHREELPIYERLGDIRSRALAMGEIADILQARGELDEALRIHREEVVPVIERLGRPDQYNELIKLGHLLIRRGEPADLAEAKTYLQQAASLAASLNLPFPDGLRSWLAAPG
jgi:tetratricopeptide (TPR) repeat protein